MYQVEYAWLLIRHPRRAIGSPVGYANGIQGARHIYMYAYMFIYMQHKRGDLQP